MGAMCFLQLHESSLHATETFSSQGQSEGQLYRHSKVRALTTKHLGSCVFEHKCEQPKADAANTLTAFLYAALLTITMYLLHCFLFHPVGSLGTTVHSECTQKQKLRYFSTMNVIQLMTSQAAHCHKLLCP